MESAIEPIAKDSNESTNLGEQAGTIRPGIRRRRFLALGTGFLAASILTPSEAAGTLASFSSPSTGQRIPREWVEHLGPLVYEYVAFLQRLPLRRITVAQIIEPHMHKRGFVRNTLPPKPLWRNIRSTLLVAERLARLLNEPVEEVVSAYRSPAYNALLPGARSNSYHMKNMALDLKFRTPPRTVARLARALRDHGLFQGGVGSYPGFTHIDTRGTKADW
jgi:hypothetical protein